LPALVRSLNDEDSAVRYWAALGLLMRREKGVQPAHAALTRALEDRSPYVRIAAAEVLVVEESVAVRVTEFTLDD